MWGKVIDLIARFERGSVRVELRLRKRVVVPGERLRGTLLLRPTGRGGRVRDLSLLLLRDDDLEAAPVFVEDSGWGLDFEVRPGVEVTYPVVIDVPDDAPASGVHFRYRLVARGRAGLREAFAEVPIVVLPRSARALRRAS